MKISLSSLNILYIAIILLWQPLQSMVLGITTTKIPFLLTIIVLATNISMNANLIKKFFIKPIVFWFFWIVFNAINSYIKGVSYSSLTYGALFAEIFVSFVIMFIVIVEYTKNEVKIKKSLLSIILIYGLLGVLNSTFYFGRFISEDLGNLLPLNLVFVIFYSSLLYNDRKIKKNSMVLLCFLSLLFIVLAGTRKAFGAAILIIMFSLLSNFRIYSFKKILFTIISFLILYNSYNYISDNTILGQRLDETYETGERVNTSNIKVLNYLGDRAPQYILAWELMVENKLTGVGLRNFMNTVQYRNTIHSEYMVQLAECGIIGSLFFLLFVGWIIINLFKIIYSRRDNREIAIIMLGAIVAILFINFTSWTYSFPFYFAVYGTVIGFILKIKSHA
jgi:hypothetical protein